MKRAHHKTPRNRAKVVIKKNDFNEYEVPTPSKGCPGSIYFTDDRDDAKDTAAAHYGYHIKCVFQRGSYSA